MDEYWSKNIPYNGKEISTMAVCKTCGASLSEEVKFCPRCGSPMSAEENGAASGGANRSSSFNKQTFDDMMNTEDVTANMDPEDIQKNKVMAVLAYLGFLILIPIFTATDSRFARYHVGQAINLWAAEVILSLIVSIFKWIPVIGVIIRILSWIVGIVIFVLAVLGLVNAVQGRAKALPLVGNIKNMFTK
jgi:uncharacterized membrane protein/ribosomal protein L40E